MPSHSEKKPVPSSETYIGWNDDDDDNTQWQSTEIRTYYYVSYRLKVSSY